MLPFPLQPAGYGALKKRAPVDEKWRSRRLAVANAGAGMGQQEGTQRVERSIIAIEPIVTAPVPRASGHVGGRPAHQADTTQGADGKPHLALHRRGAAPAAGHSIQRPAHDLVVGNVGGPDPEAAGERQRRCRGQSRRHVQSAAHVGEIRRRGAVGVVNSLPRPGENPLRQPQRQPVVEAGQRFGQNHTRRQPPASEILGHGDPLQPAPQRHPWAEF